MSEPLFLTPSREETKNRKEASLYYWVALVGLSASEMAVEQLLQTAEDAVNLQCGWLGH
ncbi:MAG: hypothetical protein P8M30_11220 [Planctomycetaceae bacterium]|nr:hypothetical protein [Planctomycetaceae bacterium]